MVQKGGQQRKFTKESMKSNSEAENTSVLSSTNPTFPVLIV